jgi:two-component system cell cycle sensor histidine kinase/response regulator CckA
MTDTQTKRPLSVLIVEDSEIDAELLIRELRRGSFDVTALRVQTASEMRHALALRQWDVILSDFTLPSFDAPGALAVVKDSGLDIPFIVMSGTVDEESAIDALRAGAHDFLSKGRLARLLPAIERELRELKVREARRRAEHELRESEQRYRRIVETTNEGVWVLDTTGSTTFVNARTASLLGYSAESLVGLSLLELLDESSRARVSRSLARREPTGHTDIQFRRQDGTDLWVMLDSTPILDRNGRYEGALVMLMDVTARRQLEDQLRQAQKMEAIGSLAGGVAHDFNNLLSVVLSYSALILEGLEPDSVIRPEVEEVQRAGERAAQLTRQLLAFSRRQVFALRVIDLRQVLTGMEPLLRRLLPANVQLSMLNAEALGNVRADPGQMEQVVMNMVVNARDAMPNGGLITIETSDVELDSAYVSQHLGVTPGRYVRLSITDNGSGMDSDTLARIFEPFFTTKEKDKGTGLGLSTAFGIVQQSGGHMWVQSELGAGTTFHVYVPRADGALDLVVKEAPVPTDLSGAETILLVEHDEAVRAVARTILRRQGYDLIEAQNGGEAFLVCERHNTVIDLLITDVVMPRMSGRELAERLAPMRPQMKVLFVSGYVEDAAVHQGQLGFGSAFLQKPITPDRLLRKVREILDEPIKSALGVGG